MQNFLRRSTMVGDILSHYLCFHITEKLPAGYKVLISTTASKHLVGPKSYCFEFLKEKNEHSWEKNRDLFLICRDSLEKVQKNLTKNYLLVSNYKNKKLKADDNDKIFVNTADMFFFFFFFFY